MVIVPRLRLIAERAHCRSSDDNAKSEQSLRQKSVMSENSRRLLRALIACTVGVVLECVGES